MLQCTIATRAPSGVVTRSISGYTLESSFSSTIIANTEVPAEILPVLFATLLVATIPVPASPSGGQTGIPVLSSPEGSRSFAPSSVSFPASAPADNTPGRISLSFQLQPVPDAATSSSNLVIIFASKSPVFMSMGNIPEASPTPRTFSPVSFQCT